jgi:hypothetical protein
VIRPLIAAALVAFPAAVWAQTGPAPSPSASATPAPDICSSGLGAVVGRPTQTTSACVVKPNQILIESGYQTQTVDVAGGAYTFQSYPLATIRIGTKLRGVEFDVIPPSAIRSAGINATADAGAGVRWQIGSTPGFAYSVNAIATAPTGTDPSANPNGLGSANAGTYVANANVQGALGKIFGYGATLSIDSLTTVTPGAAAGLGSTTTRYTSVIPSLDVTAALPSSLTLALEAYRQTNGEGAATPSHTWFDAALEKGVGNAQLDLNYGASNRISPVPGAPGVRRRYAGFGVSYLF